MFVLAIATIFLILFNFSLTNMAAVYIIGDLGSNNFNASYTITFFGIGNATSIPLADYLTKKWGFRKAIMYPMAFFTLVSFLTALAQNYPSFLLFRFLQGVFAGPLFLVFSKLFVIFGTPSQQENFAHYVILTFLTASVISSSLGGIIAYFWPWPIIFLIDGFILLIICFLLYKEFNKLEDRIEPVNFDLIGFVFFSISWISLAIFFTLGQELDWFRSYTLTTLFILGVTSFIYFIIKSYYSEYPIVNFFLCKNPLLFFALVNMMILFSSYFGLMIMLSLWLSLDVNYTPYWIAIALLTTTFGVIVFVRIIWKEKYRSNLIILGIGILLIALSCFYSQKFDVDIDFKRIAFARILAGFGFVMFLPTLFSLVIKSYSIEYRIEVLTLFQLTRVMSSALGASIYSIIWQRRSIFYYERLGEELTYFSPLTKNFLKKLSIFHFSKQQNLQNLSDGLNKQSRSLALDDCLYFIGWLMVALLIYLLLNYKLQNIEKKMD